MKKFKNIVLSIIFICLTISSLCVFGGCVYPGYRGDYPALYTEAISSILGVSGHFDGSSPCDSEIYILETDDYGRVMYTYYESGTFAICIMQKTDENYVYYYPDFNFIKTSEITWAEDLNASVKKSFSEENITNLKLLNDFEKEFDESKCIKNAITRKKITHKFSKTTEQKLEKLCKQYARDSGCKGEDSVYRYSEYCTSDNYGRKLFYIYGVHRDVNGTGEHYSKRKTMYFHLAIVFNPDWSFDETNSLLGLTDIDNYQNDLKDFKQSHNWNQPL